MNEIKLLLELNQKVKLVYSEFFITSNYIIGIPVRDSSKNINSKYLYSYYKSDILDYIPELKNTMLFSEILYDIYKAKDFTSLSVNNQVIIKRKSENTVIGKRITEFDRLEKITDKVFKLMKPIWDKPEEYVFTSEEVRKLKNYEVVRTGFDESYQMYLTISEFPLLKKFGNLKAFTTTYRGEWFDVIFETYNENESFFMLRRFLKL